MKHVTQVWVGVCLAGLALGWVMGLMDTAVGGEFTTENWQRRLALRVALAGVAPLLAAALALLRADNRRPARFVPIVLITLAVLVTSRGAVLDLADGPQRAHVVVAKTQVVGAPRYTGGCRTTYRATLDDGRRLSYDSRVAGQLRPGPYQVTMLRHNNALLSVAGARGRTKPPVSPIGWLFLGLAFAVTVVAFVLARRAGRRERFVKTRLSPWHEGRSSAFTVFFALLPQTGRAPNLVPTNWFCFAPANALLDTSAGPVQLDLADAAYGVPVTVGKREHAEQQLRALGCQRAESPPAGGKPPRRSEIWQRSIPGGTPLQALSGPDKPLLITDASPEQPAGDWLPGGGRRGERRTLRAGRHSGRRIRCGQRVCISTSLGMPTRNSYLQYEGNCMSCTGFPSG